MLAAAAKKAAAKEPDKFSSLCPPEQAAKPVARKAPPPLEVAAVGRAGEKKTRGGAVGKADPSVASPQALNALSKLAPAAETVAETTLPPARTPVTGPVASAFCDALRTWILGQGVTEVSAGALQGFHKSYPQFKDVRFAGGKNIRFAVEASSVLRWVPKEEVQKTSKDFHARIEVIDGEPVVAPAPAPQAPTPVAEAQHLPRTPCDGPVAAAFCDALRQWILGQNRTAVDTTEMGGLTQFYAAHAQFQDVRFCDGNRDSRRPGKRVSLAVEASSVLRWVPVGQGNARIEVVAEGAPPAAAAAPWPPRAPCDGPVAAAFCGALRQWILSQNLTAVASNEIMQFYEAYPQFKTARFCEEGGDPAKGGHKRRLKIVVDASSVLRWVPVDSSTGRIEVVAEGAPPAAAATTPAA